MKKLNVNILAILMAIAVLYFIFPVKKVKSYHIGFSYWYHPTVLQERWDVLVTGTVLEVEKEKPLNDSDDLKNQQGGKIKVHEVVYEGKRHEAFDYDVLDFSEGLLGLKKGDRVMLLLHWYKNSYVVGDIEGTSTNVGIKLQNMDDPIVSAMKKFVSAERSLDMLKILLKDKDLWKEYDKKGLDYQLGSYEEKVKK